MAKTNDFSNKILKDIKKKYDKALDEFAQDIALEIEEGYEFAIDSFYADYNPLWYDRTYSSYLGSSAYALGIYDPTNFNVTGDIYTVGTTVSPEYIQGKPYGASDKYSDITEWVFERTFVKGIHGINNREEQSYSRTKIYRNKKKGVAGISIQSRNIKNMHPTPKVLMDKEFKKITSKRRMSKKFNECMNKQFS